MEMTRICIKAEIEDRSLAGMCLQNLRNQILDNIPEGALVSLQQQQKDSLLFFDTMLIDLASAGLVHLVIKIIEHSHRPPGVTLRIEAGGRVAVLRDVNPQSLRTLLALERDDSNSE